MMVCWKLWSPTQSLSKNFALIAPECSVCQVLTVIRHAGYSGKRSKKLAHMLAKKRQHLLGVAAEPVVAIFEALCCALDPVEFLVTTTQGIKCTLSIAWIIDHRIIANLPHQNREFDVRSPQLARHIGSCKTAQFQNLQVNQFLVLLDTLGSRELGEDRSHVGYQWAAHAQNVFEQLRAFSYGRILRNTTQALAEQRQFHLAQARVGIDEFLHANAVSPFPLADTADTTVGRAALPMVAEVIGQDVVTGVSQVLVLDNKVDLDRLDEVTPWLAHVAWITGATHGKSVIEDDELVALSALGRDVPGLKGCSVVRWDGQIRPAFHTILVGILEDEAARHLDHTCQPLDLFVIFFGDGLLLLQSRLHSFNRNSSHGGYSFGSKSMDTLGEQ